MKKQAMPKYVLFDPGPPDPSRSIDDDSIRDICSRLRPCPFCGAKPGSPETVWVCLRGIGHMAVYCQVCRFALIDDREEKIIGNWNLRDGKQDLTGS
jgi:hypothetical protein